VKASTAPSKKSHIVAPTATTLVSKEEAISASAVLQDPLSFSKSDDDQVRALIQPFDKAIRDMRSVATCLLSSNGLSGTRILVDLGIDPRISLQPSSSSIFSSGEGLFFTVEAYSAITSSTNEATAPKNNDPTSSASSVKKRHKGMGGILVEGGHFEQCLTSDYLQTSTPVTAFGFRLRMEVITTLIVKKLMKLRSSKGGVVQHIGPQPVVASSGIVPFVFIVSLPDEGSIESMVISADSYSPHSAAQVFCICEELRSLGISATGYIHHLLRGMEVGDMQPSLSSSLDLISLCRNIGIQCIVHIIGPSSANIQNASFRIINLVRLLSTLSFKTC
jgi:hypothetical protein